MHHPEQVRLRVTVPASTSTPCHKAAERNSKAFLAQLLPEGSPPPDVQVVTGDVHRIQAVAHGLPDDDAHESIKVVLFIALEGEYSVHLVDPRSGKEYEERVRCDHL